MSELRNEADNPEVVHEESDVNVGAILGFGGALLVIAIIIHVFLWWLQGVYTRQTEQPQAVVYPLAAGQQEQRPAEPRLQENPQEDMRRLRARQQAALEQRGWVKQEAGIARIPIEEAMRIVVERGLPTRGAPQKEAGK